MENLNKNDVSRRPGSAQTEAPDPRSSGLPARPLRTRTRSGGPAVKKQPEQTNKPSIPNLKQGVRSEGSPARRLKGSSVEEKLILWLQGNRKVTVAFKSLSCDTLQQLIVFTAFVFTLLHRDSAGVCAAANLEVWSGIGACLHKT